jgi:hypothetical protein
MITHNERRTAVHRSLCVIRLSDCSPRDSLCAGENGYAINPWLVFTVEDGVEASASLALIAARTAIDPVVAITRGDAVVSPSSVDIVVAIGYGNGIIATACRDTIVATQ